MRPVDCNAPVIETVGARSGARASRKGGCFVSDTVLTDKQRRQGHEKHVNTKTRQTEICQAASQCLGEQMDKRPWLLSQ